MSESTSSQAPHQPGVYVKNGVTRNANSAAKAVALVFDGYVRQPDGVTVEEVSNTLEVAEPVEAKPAAPKPTAPKTKDTA